MSRKKRKISAKENSKTEVKNGILNRFKLTESYTSMILGAIVVLVIGILFFSFAKGNRNTQTSSIKDEPKAQQQKSQDSKTSSTYTVKPGDDLWSISENFYNNGYRWIEIAKINKLENPGLIYSGNKLMIPTSVPTIVKKEPAAQKLDQGPQTQNSVIQNNSISGETYKIKKGDNLWDIAVRAYGDGFKWPEIARANSLENPDLIFSNNVLKIPR